MRLHSPTAFIRWMTVLVFWLAALLHLPNELRRMCHDRLVELANVAG